MRVDGWRLINPSFSRIFGFFNLTRPLTCKHKAVTRYYFNDWIALYMVAHQRWVIVADGGPTTKQHWIDISRPTSLPNPRVYLFCQCYLTLSIVS